MEHKPTVILLGGSGFIGSHLAHDFHGRGWRVIVVTRFPDQTRDRLGPGIEPSPPRPIWTPPPAPTC